MHQGNGTASILADAPTVFTFLIHAAANFPFRKEASDPDIELPDATEDRAYLEALEVQVGWRACAVTMAGGYARAVEDTVDIHFATVQLAAHLLG